MASERLPADRGNDNLARALAEGRIEVWYQPIVDLPTGRPVGVEALARLHEPDGTVRAPNTFVPRAEAAGLIIDLDRTVITQALDDRESLRLDGGVLRLHANLSARHLDDVRHGQALIDLAEHAGVRLGELVLELTESRRPDDLGAARMIIDRLRSAGLAIWLDDFGTGASGVEDLQTFAVDGIKIDRRYAARLGSAAGDAAVAAVVEVARRFGLPVIIEGVETTAQLARAVELGCDQGQGHLWSPAVPIAEWPRRSEAWSRTGDDDQRSDTEPGRR